MREHPIIFSSESVRAILEGRKTQTRRVPKCQPLKWCTRFEPAPFEGYGRPPGWIQMTPDAVSQRGWCKCPYGKVGDRLWVKELWQDKFNYGASKHTAIYRADRKGIVFGGLELINIRWKSPMFMPRWASRIVLEITNIRVERVQGISEEDAEKEGMVYFGETLCEPTPKEKYSKLWDSINAKRGYSWASNPWVWVIEFKRVEGQ